MKKYILTVTAIAITLLTLMVSNSAPIAQAAPCNVAGLIGSNTTWSPNSCSPYIVTGNIIVNTNVTLTIQPGTTIKFSKGTGMVIRGALVARGTANNRVTFTSNSTSPAKGDWTQILFEDSSIDASFDANGNYMGGSIIQYATVEYGGYYSTSSSKVVLEAKSSLFVDNSIIQNNSGGGIYISIDYNTLVIYVTNNTVTNNGDTGIQTEWGSKTTISGNTVSNNKGTGIVSYSSNATISNNTIQNNTSSKKGGGISNFGNALISGNIISNNNGKSEGGGIYNAHDDVTINNNTINNNTAYNGGGISLGYGYNSSNVKITNNKIIDNHSSFGRAYKGGGIYVDASYIKNLVVSNNTIVGNYSDLGGGIYVNYHSDDSNVIINDNNIYDNTDEDIYNYTSDSNSDINATNNWWGTTDKTEIESHIYHQVDDVSLGLVIFEPYRMSPVTSAPATPAPTATPTKTPTITPTPTRTPSPTATPKPLSTIIPPSGGNLTSNDSNHSVTLQFPNGAVTQDTEVTYIHLVKSTYPTENLIGVDRFFLLIAKQNGTIITQFNQPVTIKVDYAANSPVLPNTTYLYWWNGQQWVTDGITFTARTNSSVTSQTNHFTRFAILGETRRVYLPLLLRK